MFLGIPTSLALPSTLRTFLPCSTFVATPNNNYHLYKIFNADVSFIVRDTCGGTYIFTFECYRSDRSSTQAPKEEKYEVTKLSTSNAGYKNLGVFARMYEKRNKPFQHLTISFYLIYDALHEKKKNKNKNTRVYTVIPSRWRPPSSPLSYRVGFLFLSSSSM